MISMPPVIIFLKCLPKIKAWIFTMITLCLFVLSVYLNNRYTTTEIVPNTLFYFAVASSVLTTTVGLLQVNTVFLISVLKIFIFLYSGYSRYICNIAENGQMGLHGPRMKSVARLFTIYEGYFESGPQLVLQGTLLMSSYNNFYITTTEASPPMLKSKRIYPQSF